MTSFDPRTWHVGHRTPTAPEPVAEAQPAAPPAPGEPARATWLGFVLSAAILASGAVGAWAMRPADSALNAGLQSASAAANG